MMKPIVVDNLCKEYGAVKALDSISFEVDSGSFFGCFGPNGAGKTTLLRILTGQIPPTSGKASVLDMDVSEGTKIRQSVGIVPEVESPPSYLTAFEFLFFVGRVREVQELEQKIGRWLRFFDLEEARGTLCKDLSKGMRQKLMLAAAFIHDPPLLFLDEPFINLDPVYQKKLGKYLISLEEGGRTIFLCSHILDIAQRLCKEVIILKEGTIVDRESISDLESRGENLESIFLRLVGGNDEDPS